MSREARNTTEARGRRRGWPWWALENRSNAAIRPKESHASHHFSGRNRVNVHSARGGGQDGEASRWKSCGGCGGGRGRGADVGFLRPGGEGGGREHRGGHGWLVVVAAEGVTEMS